MSLKDFLANGLQLLDNDIEERIKKASSNGNVLRYVCVIENSRYLSIYVEGIYVFCTNTKSRANPCSTLSGTKKFQILSFLTFVLIGPMHAKHSSVMSCHVSCQCTLSDRQCTLMNEGVSLYLNVK